MRAIRKIEERFIEQTPLDLCLDCWVRWLEYPDLDIGWRGKALGLVGNSSRSSDEIYFSLELEAGRAVDAMVDSLATHHAWAIRKRCSVATVWRFPQLNFIAVLLEAEKELEKKIEKEYCHTQLLQLIFAPGGIASSKKTSSLRWAFFISEICLQTK